MRRTDENIAAVALWLNGVAAQKPEDGGIPPSGKGDTVVVRDCVSGSLLKDLRAQKNRAGDRIPDRGRLSDDRREKLLQVIQKEHQDQVLDVSGVLASNPNSSSTVRSKEIGKARVFVVARRQETSEPVKPPSDPALQVTSFEVVRPGCAQ